MQQDQDPVPGDPGLLDLLPEVAPRIEEFPEECLDCVLPTQFAPTRKLGALLPHGVLIEWREGTLNVPLVQRPIGGEYRIRELVHGTILIDR
jgi:hypothetical protein